MSDVLGSLGSAMSVPIIIGLIVFLIIVIVGLIVDRRRTWKILQWVLIGIGVVLLGWVAARFKVNIGKYINQIFGNRRKKMPSAVLNESGQVIGQEVGIVKSKNPIRDHGVIKTTDGQEIELPKGVSDIQVERVTVVDTGYQVEVKHESLTDIFGSSASH